MKWIATITFLALTSLNIFAWGSAGHMVIAAEAFRQLQPETQAQIFTVLEAHPDFSKWTNSYHPNPNIDLATYVFMKSSTWPDEIRRSGSQYDHPNWHFIDYPLRPPTFTFEPDARPQDDILFGIEQCEQTLNDLKADRELRAVYLSYLVHLVGDIHQPLHCESYFDSDCPNGDRGGNDVFVKPAQRGVRLHGIWDGLLGTSSNPQTQWKYAVQLNAEFPRTSLPELTQDTTPKSWSLESRKLAVEKGYLNGELKDSKTGEDAPELPADYLKNAKEVAEKRGALAGYRLAGEINKYLKEPQVLLLPKNMVVVESSPKKISAEEASRYYDQDMIVTGKVVQVTSKSSVTFLTFDQPYPNSPFQAVIFAANLDKFNDLQGLKGKEVEISGIIQEYRGKPEIVVDEPGQISEVADTK